MYIALTTVQYGIYCPGGNFDLRHRWATSVNYTPGCNTNHSMQHPFLTNQIALYEFDIIHIFYKVDI